ncbi:3-hydroxyacyl-CoA dehydrogenase family protein [Streptomyces europaeiscabiei]|uniref:3-hydroxyacyl-CoA dehydrogenase NAD-binding domain-containing protein n=1 Tax=Streptomyces europaeiscabiei TaxID=146819 RepID=A0ABU4NVB7_9ACTN|nr:3-hydroxyacyl-CoA dehydrogenase NAD-binding domain-containing protein [Streptomyces europaeiscabiei]MDX2531346.1 3-hydroxyacyl-CoA dehydrogenase NAD-binding domain-containing protein [Streptomyces europaeiscabiei]MDX2759421.1 3-hydroxyacyl-CoA dehydrogenase NAD-binding domain-containing protein [Streptomyces europaeiscabiei]MDX2769044.1 3-hydroxyacyl-CoA dehydrogenase NAD-binding domain-containing protein [Streptomyces europaeiscabiei]MDX3549831.1 3-hydroxyacyl-CoA dehydrogenase NAD-binding 
MEFTTVGVVGAGVMGVGVAQNLAQTGHQVILVDVSEEVLDNARRELRTSLRAFALFNRAAAVDPAAVIEKIEFSTDYELLAKADFVVENVTEDWGIKEKVYERLDRICRPDVRFAVNTSAISITRVGSVTNRPQNIVGMHFMNPVPMKPMVEVIRGHHTTPETIDTARRFLAGMGKECIVVEDVPGFVSNRVLMLTINEAVFLVQDGVASPADIDRLFKTCFDHKMGPLETADLIGLDTILKSVEVLYESFNDSKYRPAPLLKKMVAAGLLGRKSGEGFFNYR